MQEQGQFITLREGAEATALIAPELGAWLLRYMRHLPDHGDVDALYFSQEVVDRYPNQMYAGNPLLFPQVSFTHSGGREHHYEWQGQTFSLPQHGFARRSRWKVSSVNETAVAMELTDSAETRQVFPFSFRSTVKYELREGGLRLEQTVENTGAKILPFSTGIHPYFPVPVTARGTRAACYVEIPPCRMITPRDDWRSWSAAPFPERKLPVNRDVSGTLFLTDLAERKISLVDPEGGIRITLDFTEAPAHKFLAIWSKSTQEPYYCLEPWTALPNSFSRKQTELILLQPGERFAASFLITLSALE